MTCHFANFKAQRGLKAYKPAGFERAKVALDCAASWQDGWEIEKTWPRDLRMAVLKAVEEVEAASGN
jgi:hypothetical protein